MDELVKLTVRISALPEFLMVRFSGLRIAVPSRPHRRFDHVGADKELHNSGYARQEKNITPGSWSRKLEPDELCDHNPDHDGKLGENPCDMT